MVMNYEHTIHAFVSYIIQGGIALGILYESYQLITNYFDRKNKKKIERKEELYEKRDEFYKPLKNAFLKIDIEKILELNQKVVNKENPHNAFYEINQMWWSFREDYDNIKNDTDKYASDNVKTSIDKFTDIFLSNRLFSEKFTEKYRSLNVGENKPAVKINECVQKSLDGKYLSAAEHISDYYTAALDAIEKDIQSFNDELAKL